MTKEKSGNNFCFFCSAPVSLFACLSPVTIISNKTKVLAEVVWVTKSKIFLIVVFVLFFLAAVLDIPEV